MEKTESSILEKDLTSYGKILYLQHAIKLANGDPYMYTHTALRVAPIFGNCQMFALGNIQSILSDGITTEDLKLVMRKVAYWSGLRPLCLMDIKLAHVDRILALLDPYIIRIVYNQPYISTNYSSMNTVMVKLNVKLLVSK